MNEGRIANKFSFTKQASAGVGLNFTFCIQFTHKTAVSAVGVKDEQKKLDDSSLITNNVLLQFVTVAVKKTEIQFEIFLDQILYF